jgi:dynein heavy chain
MNPHLDKKTILPDNLKYLFRTISMIVPDNKIIVEAYLLIYGFKKYKILSEKIITIY